MKKSVTLTKANISYSDILPCINKNKLNNNKFSKCFTCFYLIYVVIVSLFFVLFLLFTVRQNNIRLALNNNNNNMLDYYKSARINYIEKRCNEYNLNLEVHKIITEDGYINTAFRIRNLEAINNINKENNIYTSNQYPVIINHGLLDNCYTFLVLNRDKAIPYVLADLGYDVWLTNNRGSTFSYEHINSNKIDSNMDSFNISSDYWEFSFYEIAKYDLIANIEYIKKISNKTKVNYVGHSQGGFQVLLSYTINYVYLDNSINKFVSLGTVPKFIEIVSNLLIIIII